MSRIHIIALLALSALALPTSTAFAQAIFGPGMTPQTGRSNPGRVTEGKDVETCQAAAGGSRVRANCEIETTTVRAEQEIKLSFEIPALISTQCSATTTTEYMQVNTLARINSKLEIADCTAASGAFTVAVRIRDDSGEEKPLEFNETWQRSDDQDVIFTADYPIGDNVELRSVRVRGLSCTCTDPPQEDIEVREPAVAPE
jgi:type 1 fimbria pilin